MATPARRRRMRLLCLMTLALASAFVATGSGAAVFVEYVATQKIPVPPPSNFQANAGGDGWSVGLTPQRVFNVFHHDMSMIVACRLQSADAPSCWSPKTIRDLQGRGFRTSGESGLAINQGTGKMYIYGTRSDSTGGVVCFDTTAPDSDPNPFCGFTALTDVGEAPASSWGALSAPAQVGSRLFSFNYVGGQGVSGARNTLLCFDIESGAACAGQPYTVDLGLAAQATVYNSLPSPSVAAVGNRVIIPVESGGTAAKLACFDGAALTGCGGSWPATLESSDYQVGGPFPLLDGNANITGVCLPLPGVPCFNLAGKGASTPAKLPAAMSMTSWSGSSPWNGPAVVIGPRVYVPNGNTNQVHCFDYNLGESCANFPKGFSNLGYLYTVNPDPQRPTCLWVNADNGAYQIQNFDAFTGGACGEGPIRVRGDSVAVSTPLCTPGEWSSLKVVSPARNSYASGTVSFQDTSGVAIPGAGAVALDNAGTADLSGLPLDRGTGLPQFLITLSNSEGAPARPGEVVVELRWTGAYDPSCAAKPGTTVPNAPTAGGPPAVSDVNLTLSAPAYGETGQPLRFAGVVTNTGPDAATGITVNLSIPPAVTVDSATTSAGLGCVPGVPVTRCYVGTLASGQKANLGLVLRKGTAGGLLITGTTEADRDPSFANNSAFASTTVVGPNTAYPAPPRPTQPATYNAVGHGVLVDGAPQPDNQVFQVKPGAVVDTTNGYITLIGFDGSFGTFSSGEIREDGTIALPSPPIHSQFRIAEGPDGLTVLELVGGNFSVCTAPRRVSAVNTTPVRQLWGSAKGKFRTAGRYSAATVRGTIWLVQDRCDGTLTVDRVDNVDVSDFPLSKTVGLSPGQQYLAQPLATKKPPAQKKIKKKKLKKKKK